MDKKERVCVCGGLNEMLLPTMTIFCIGAAMMIGCKKVGEIAMIIDHSAWPRSDEVPNIKKSRESVPDLEESVTEIEEMVWNEEECTCLSFSLFFLLFRYMFVQIALAWWKDESR